MNFWNRWKYKYLTLVLLGFIPAAYLAGNETFKNFLLNLGTWEFVGAFLAGLFFVSSFTVAISTVIIAILAENIHPLAIALIGGVGAAIGDLLIFRFIKNHLSQELALLFGREGTAYIKKVIHSPYVAWTLPIIGIFIIASPLPDELGVSLLGLSNLSEKKFLIISFISNSFGILAIASVARVL